MAALTEADTCHKCVLPKLYDAGWDDDEAPKNSVDPEFALWVLLSPKAYVQLRGQRYSPGKLRPDLFKIRALALPFPPLFGQHRVVECLGRLQAKANNLNKLQRATSKELDALMPSLLSNAFSGEL